MTDPRMRHAVCPECHTHQPSGPDGRLQHHNTTDGNGGEDVCPGSLDYPSRVTSGRYSEGSQFESCPAATGEPAGLTGCPQFPDGAHRCAQGRRHTTGGTQEHRCTCGSVWFSQSGTVGELAEFMNRRLGDSPAPASSDNGRRGAMATPEHLVDRPAELNALTRAWLPWALERVNGIAVLDDPELQPATESAATAARALLHVISALYTVRPEIAPQPLPDGGGGIFLHWRERGFSLDVDVDPDGRIGGWLARNSDRADVAWGDAWHATDGQPS